jgi:hypothetical protein
VARSTAQTHARQLSAALTGGMHLRPVALPAGVWDRLGADPGEYPVGYLSSRLQFARQYATKVHYIGGGPTVLVGSPQFVTGAVVGSILRQAVQSSRARRAAAPQWHPTPLIQAVLTTRRLWCQVLDPDGPRWVHLGFDGIVSLDLRRRELVVWFSDAEPLRLAGEDAPWCAAVIAHFRFGPAAVRVLPNWPQPSQLAVPAAGDIAGTRCGTRRRSRRPHLGRNLRCGRLRPLRFRRWAADSVLHRAPDLPAKTPPLQEAIRAS